jgi:MFS family permease
MNPTEAKPVKPDSGYSRYALVVLVIVYVFNFLDRQILSILAEDIKADLGISDAQIGFLYGTAFAVFYAVFGIPMGRLADNWVRTRLIAIGLAFWSLSTALSGLARSFAPLAVCRFAVGIGEASASPAANSLLADYFSPKARATVVSIYASGIYIGSGIGIFLGGSIVDAWNAAYPLIGEAPFGLRGWQVAFMAVGLPGILVALWVATLREPQRGISEGLEVKTNPHPFRAMGQELMAIIPPFNLFSLLRHRGGAAAIGRNLAIAAACAASAWLLWKLTDDLVQWSALAIAVYASSSWVQGLVLRDPESFERLFRNPALILAMFGFPFITFMTYGVGFWVAPYMIRYFGIPAGELGLNLGLVSAIGGWCGLVAGGMLADVLYRRMIAGRFVVALAASVISVPILFYFAGTESQAPAYVALFVFFFVSSSWLGASFSAIADLAPPEVRSTAIALYLMLITFIGLALGPHLIGYASDALAARGADGATALRSALLLSLLALVPGMLLISAAALIHTRRTHARSGPEATA